MPFFKFHFVEASRMAGVSRRMADRLQETIGCPREHIVFELDSFQRGRRCNH